MNEEVSASTSANPGANPGANPRLLLQPSTVSLPLEWELPDGRWQSMTVTVLFHGIQETNRLLKLVLGRLGGAGGAGGAEVAGVAQDAALDPSLDPSLALEAFLKDFMRGQVVGFGRASGEAQGKGKVTDRIIAPIPEEFFQAGLDDAFEAVWDAAGANAALQKVVLGGLTRGMGQA